MKIKKNKTYIIAEIGINHEGKYNIAKKMILSAAKAGADAVKFQLFNPKTLAGPQSIKTSEQKKRTNRKENLLQMWARMTFNKTQWVNLKKIAKSNSVDFICSVFDFESLQLSKKIGLDAWKIASSDLTDLKLFDHLKNNKKPIILSTGMGSVKEITTAVKRINSKKIYILHCVSMYPCPKEFINLNRMLSLKKNYNFPIGYSDHSSGVDACIGAITMGAKIIEKHFTLNKSWKGSDHELSADFKDLKIICDYAKNINLISGNGIIEPSKKEARMRKFFRKSIFAKRDIHPEEIITLSMIDTRRPASFLDAGKMDLVFGKKVKKKILKDENIKLSSIY